MTKKRNGESRRSRFVSVTELAADIGITPRRVQQLVKQGIFLRKGRGKYAGDDCSRRYWAYMEWQKREYGYVRSAGPRTSEALNDLTILEADVLAALEV